MLIKKIIFTSMIVTTRLAVSYAIPVESQISITNESKKVKPVILTAEDIVILKKVAEKEKLNAYSGNVGTAPENKTISAIGGALENAPSGPQAFVFWTQTLANGFYYEGRIYGKYNTKSQNPSFPDVLASGENNPNGYKGVVKLGYAYNINDIYAITPYIRLEAGSNMSLVYADLNGNYINSTNYAFLVGFKQTFRSSEYFSPYIDIYGGVNQVLLNGNLYDNGSAGAWTNNAAKDALLNQYQFTTEFGAAYKITKHQSIIPYISFQYNVNDGDNTASLAKNQGGFGINSLTTNQQVYAVKYSYAY